MKKFLIIIAIILVLAGVGYYFYGHNQAYAPNYDVNNYQPNQNRATPTEQAVKPNGQTQTVNNTSTPDYTPPQSATGGENTGSNVQVTEVDFDGTKFTPNPVKINVGDYIFFKNKSTEDFWPAALQNGYPGFDSLKNIAPGGEYKFQFTKAGSWNYYDYSHPSVLGTVIVSK